MKKSFKFFAVAIIACIMVAGAITVISCSKDSETKQTIHPSYLSTKGGSTLNQLQNVMAAYFAACDSAYQADSATFLTVCANNDTINFLKVTGISAELLSTYRTLALQELEDFVKDNPTFKPDENPCTSCSYNALPRLAAIASATSGHMAALIPFKIGGNDRQRLANCISWCEIMTTPCGMSACLSACMGEYNFETYGNILYPMNTINPYDNAGIWHNKLLGISNENILKNYYENGIVSMANSITITNTILSSYGFDTTGNRSATNNIWGDLDNYFINVMGNASSNEMVNETLMDIVYDLYQLMCKEEPNYDEYKKIIEKSEYDVISGNVFPEKDMAIFLTTTSIMRFSLYYWSTFNFNFVPTKGLPKWVKWVVTGVADAAGAVGGAVSGGTAASAVPGVGTAVGAIAGGITGAVSASGTALSACEKIDKLIDEKKPTTSGEPQKGGN